MKFESVKIGNYLYIKGRIGWKGLKKDEYLEESNYRIINGESLTTDGIDWSKAGYITKERYDESPEIMLQEEDILISKDGTIGKIGYIEHLEKPTTVASGIFVVRNLQPEIINTRFIYNYLCSNDFKNFIVMRTEGSVIPHLYQKDFVDLDFPLPKSDIQNKIVKILDSISQKISVNKKINENLEQQAQALFKSWFVEFEPFGGNLPSTWKAIALGDVTYMSAGGDKPKNVSDVKNDVFAVPIFSNGISDEGLYGYTDIAKIQEECVTVSARGTVGFVCLRQEPFVPIVRLVTLIPKEEYISSKYLYFALKQMNIVGTGTTQQQLTVPAFRTSEILIPSQEIMKKYTEAVTPMFNLIRANKSENIALSNTRDALLPKLMSGEINVSEVTI